MSILHHPGHSAIVPASGGARLADVYAAQQQTMWCWAACAQMVLQCLGVAPALTQCEIAGKRFGVDCCASPGPCNHPCPTAEVENLYITLGVGCHCIEKPLDRERLLAEATAERPVQILYMYLNRTVGHYVLVVGEYSSKSGRVYLRVADPHETRGKRSVLFEDFEDVTTDKGRGTWAWTWFKMKRRSSDEHGSTALSDR